MKAKKKVLKRWVRISLFLIVLILASIGLRILILSYNKPETAELIYSYNINQNLDYKVELYENSYTETNTLDADENYIADLIKNINATFKYNYSGSKIEELNYTYNVKAFVTGEYNIDDEDEKVLNKEYVIEDDVTETVNDTTNFSVEENVDIDYNFYN